MTHTAELIAVGTELLLGNIANTNGQFLSRELSSLGINVFFHTVVGDNPDRLKDAIAIARTRADIIITTGGLGPTCDDLTKQTLANAFGKELLYHEPSAKKLEAYFAKLGRPITENNYQQVMLPDGCTILENDRGTAPGCAFTADGCLVIMLPGPPFECQAMFTQRVAPLLREQSDGMIVSRTLRVYGIGESAAEALLRDQMNELTNPTLAPYAKGGEVELRITAKADTEQAAQKLIAPVEEEVRGILGDKIYGADVDSLEAVCSSLLRDAGLTVGTAESCTGGIIAKRLTDLAGASDLFLGSIVSYADATKQTLLGISPDLLQKEGAVCPAVAEAMAKGARRALGCDLALSTTGVAGPGPDGRGNPPGLVFVALDTPKGCIVRELQSGFMSREQVRMSASQFALDLLRRYLTGILPIE